MPIYAHKHLYTTVVVYWCKYCTCTVPVLCCLLLLLLPPLHSSSFVVYMQYSGGVWVYARATIRPRQGIGDWQKRMRCRAMSCRKRRNVHHDATHILNCECEDEKAKHTHGTWATGESGGCTERHLKIDGQRIVGACLVWIVRSVGTWWFTTPSMTYDCWFDWDFRRITVNLNFASAVLHLQLFICWRLNQAESKTEVRIQDFCRPYFCRLPKGPFQSLDCTLLRSEQFKTQHLSNITRQKLLLLAPVLSSSSSSSVLKLSAENKLPRVCRTIPTPLKWRIEA